MELFIDGKLSENRDDWKRELQEALCGRLRRPRRDRREAEGANPEMRKIGVRTILEGEEISVDLVLQTSTRLCDNKVKRSEGQSGE